MPPLASERLRRFTRTHSPLQPPRFRRRHALGLACFVILFLFGQKAPGVLADVSGFQIGDIAVSWQIGMYLRTTIVLLGLWVLFGVRGQHWLSIVAISLGLLGYALRLGETRITHDPITLGLVLLQLFALLILLRIATRQPDPRKEQS